MSEYLDGDWSADQRASFEAALGEDELAELSGLQQMLTFVHNLPAVHAPPDFYDAVRRRIRRRRRGTDDWLGTLITLPFQVLSIVIILAIAAIFMMSEIDRDRSTLERDPETHNDGEYRSAAEERVTEP